MAPLFKTGSDLLEQGLDLARRRDFARARQKFLEAGSRFTKEGSILYVNLSGAYAELMRLGQGVQDPASLASFATFLRDNLGDTQLRPGPRGIAARDLAVQLGLWGRDAALLAAAQSGVGDRAAIAQALQALANDYRQLGNAVLFLPELLDNQSVLAESRVPLLMALSYETLGVSTQHSDPLSAAEHFQTAQQYWTQAGDEARAHAAAQRVQDLGFRAKCWFCGREGIGHGVQFVSMPIDQDVSSLKGADGSPLPSHDRSGGRIFACKGCNSAVRLLADQVADFRANQVRQQLLIELNNLEQRLRGAALQRAGV